MSKKKWVIIVAAFFVLIFCLVLFLPIPVKLKKEITIESSLMNVSNQLTDLQNWKHWYPLFNNEDTSLISYSNGTKNVNANLHIDKHDFTIVNVSPVAITLKEKDERKEIYESFILVPDSSTRFTYVNWIRIITPFIWLREKYNLNQEMESGLHGLKKFMEDPQQFYGFPIEIRPVVDTLVITKNAVVTEKDIPIALQKLYANLQQYAQINKIYGTDQRIAGFVPSENNKVEVIAGIVVNKKMPETDGIKYLSMPRTGRMLVGRFEGDYKNIKLLYNSVERYIADKHLKKAAMPYEKYLTDPYSSQDSLQMKVEVYFPIF